MALVPGIINGGAIQRGPSTNGTNGQVLTGDGSGNLSFQDAAGELDADLVAIAALGYTSGSYLLKKTAANTYSLISITSAGEALLDDANAAAQLTTLGAAADSAVVHLAGTETISGAKTFSTQMVVSATNAAQGNTQQGYLESHDYGGGIAQNNIVLGAKTTGAPNIRVQVDSTSGHIGFNVGGTAFSAATINQSGAGDGELALRSAAMQAAGTGTQFRLVTSETRADVILPANVPLTFLRAVSSTDICMATFSGSGFSAYLMMTDGSQLWGSGAATRDVRARRSGTKTYTFDDTADGPVTVVVNGVFQCATTAQPVIADVVSSLPGFWMGVTGTRTLLNYTLLGTGSDTYLNAGSSLNFRIGNVATASVTPSGLSVVSGVTMGRLLTTTPATPAQITSNQNNYAPTAASILRLSTDASRDITGLSVSQASGARTEIWNVGAQNIVLKHEDTNSTAANRFTNSTGADITLAAGEEAILKYDGVTTRWRVRKL